MRRRHLLALPALGLLGSCASEDAATDPTTAPAPDPTTGSASDAGGEPSGEPSTEAPTSKAPSTAQTLLDSLSPREIAGQLVLVGIVQGTAPTRTLGKKHHVGGYFLLQVWRSAEEVRSAVAAAQEHSRADLPPLLAVDQEGGKVRMLRGDAAPKTPDAEQLGAEGPEAVRAAYSQIGEALKDLGLHVDLAPVADTVDPELGDENAPVGELDRGFGTDPATVSACVEAAVQGLTEHDVAATLKHFPGLGGVKENTDHSAEGIIDHGYTRDDPMLTPFRAGIDAGADLVMLSSGIYPRLHENIPAMHSRTVVTEILRGDLGFHGLVITDDIGAAKAVATIPVPERVTRVLEAGGDAVLTADPALAGEMVDAIQEWAAASPEQDQRVREAALRMLLLKEKLGLIGR